MGTGQFNAGGSPAMDQHPIQGGVEILLVTSCYRNRDKLRPNGHPCSLNKLFRETHMRGVARDCFNRVMLIHMQPEVILFIIWFGGTASYQFPAL